MLSYHSYAGADPGFSEGGVRIRDGSRREELTLVLYLGSRGSGGHIPPEAMGYLILFSTKIPYNARLKSKFIKFLNLNGLN